MITHRWDHRIRWDCPIPPPGSLGLGVGADGEQEEVQRQGADTRVVGLDNGGLRGHPGSSRP